MALRIEDYALIGDCETAALVGRDGSIDWLCWPRFDSAACFAALLGTPEHGRWLIAPAGPTASQSRAAIATTRSILETDFETADGGVTVIDFMPLRGGEPSDLVRIVVGERGRVAMRTRTRPALRLRLDRPVGDAARRRRAARDRRAGHGGAAHAGRRCTARTCTTVGEFDGRRRARALPFVLTYGRLRTCRRRSRSIPQQRWRDTEAFWRDWAGTLPATPASGPTPCCRSLITLKALTYAPTGGIVAAPTTSLPEQLGGVRNWDYRYCWLRDATFTLLALMNAGYFEEARAWREWLLRAVAGSPDADADHVRRRRRAAARRSGSCRGCRATRARSRCASATPPHGQLQLDVYGEVMDALHQARARRLGASEPRLGRCSAPCSSISRRSGASPTRASGRCAAGAQHFTHSKVMAWVAFDRAIKQRRAVRPRRAASSAGGRLRSEIHAGRLPQRLRPEARRLRRSPTARSSSTRACC